MRSIPEIDAEFKNVCLHLGHAYAQKKAIAAKIDDFVVRLNQLEDEAAARRLIDAEKAKEAEEKIANPHAPSAD